MNFKLTMSDNSFDTFEETKPLRRLGFFIEKEIKGYSAKLSVEPTLVINTIEELVAFTKKYGKIIVNSDEIEIYNGFRE